MEEENKIQDGEIVPDSSEEISEREKEKKRKRSLYVEMALFFILGILVGITLKTEADKKITIGFDDYQMNIKKQDYNINKIEADLIKKSSEESAQNQSEELQNENQGGGEGAGTPQNQAENENPSPVSNEQ
ncbi:MAG TPA: hypothetical protein P5262_03965 [Candidatus Moranbacteria bacterium]|nr:hypothetical protein [Candidatus Moranbacteria bacterium]